MSRESNPGYIVSFFRSTFGFRKTTLSFLVLLSYLASILITVYYEKKALTVPLPEPSILSSSWLDLQQITKSPHPYDSHANDDVHDYILEKAKLLSKKQPYIEYSDDFNARSIFKQIDVFNSENPMNRVIYFESGNVLVKIEGKDPSLEGILISAHYDGVPSAYGVTDDGMGIASMLGILEHFASTGEQPLRNIVFNFNNNEEFGLLGASVFFNHKWSKLVKYFINLEGTGAGGRSVLFRATDNGIAQYYNTVRSPFGNSILQQGFQSGLIRSETDYKIYLENGLRGVDIAFYKPRNLYHTKFDNIQGSSKGALWHMLSNSLDLLTTLSNKEGISTDISPAAFFDILGLTFFSLSVDTLYVLNIILLTVLPVFTIILLLIVGRRETWFVGLAQGWLRLPISVVASTLATLSLTNSIDSFNPLVLGSDWFSPLISLASFFILINYLIINFFSWWMPVHDQKLIFFLEISFLLWILLIVATVRQHVNGLSGEYSISVIYLLGAISTIFGLFTLVFKSRPSFKNYSVNNSYGSIPRDGPLEASSRKSTTHLTGEGEHEPLLSSEEDNEPNRDETEQQQHSFESSPEPEIEPETEETFNQKLKSAALKSFSYDWSIQFLIFVPLTIFITYDLGELVMQGLNYTVQESDALGASTFKLLTYFAIFLGLPLLPFIHKLNFFLFMVVSVGFLIATGISFSKAPFNTDSPLKVSFVQSIDLTRSAKHSYGTISGKGAYLEDIVNQLPSVSQSTSKPQCSVGFDGRGSCVYDNLRPWLIDGTVTDNDFSNYLKIEVLNNDNNDTENKRPSPYAPLSADIRIWAPDNRNCVVGFNTTKYSSERKSSDNSLVSPVKTLRVYHDGEKYITPNGSTNSLLFARQQQELSETDSSINVKIPSGPSYDPIEDAHVFKLMGGIDDFQLHKVNFTAPYYHINLEWMPNFDFDDEDIDVDADGNNLGLTVSCFWGEYESNSIINDNGEIYSKRKLPAYDELLQYAPNYVSVSNSGRGLLSVKNYVEL